MPAAVIGWLIALIVFLVVEAVTVSLVSLWFAGGAFSALIAAALGAGTAMQCVIFILVSAVLLALMLPFTRKHLNQKHTRTNADRLIGRNVLVTEEIDNLRETGEIRVNGVLWTAVSTTGAVLACGTLVTIERMEGAKVYVRPVESASVPEA